MEGADGGASWRVAEVLPAAGEAPRAPGGYLDLVGRGQPPPTGVAMALMRSPLVATVYDRLWRPALGRLVKGVHGPSLADEVGMARRMLAAGDGDTVVDMACGPGTFARAFAADVGSDGTVIGIDLSAAMLTRAVRETRAPRVVYVRADATQLWLREASVDVVGCFAAFHLFSDPFGALDRMAAALVPGGRLAILTTARPGDGPVAATAGRVAHAAGVRTFSGRELTRAVEARGLRVTEHTTFGVLQLVAARRLSDRDAAAEGGTGRRRR